MRKHGFTLLELTLTVSIALAMLAGSVFFMRQQNNDSKIQQSKMRLELIRTAIASFRYKYGRYPQTQEMYSNVYAGANIVPGFTGATVSEPVTGGASISDTINSGVAGVSVGWIYTQGAGTISPNISLANHPELQSDPPSQW